MQSDKDFEEILTDFFKKHDKRQLRHRKPHKIAVIFKGREQEVMEHLCKKYNVAPKTIKGMSSLSPALPPNGGDGEPTPTKSKGKTVSHVEKKVDESAEETVAQPDKKPKSKKKLFIILLIILLAAAGAAGYFFKDKIFGETIGTEVKPPIENTEKVAPVKEEVEKTEEPAPAKDEVEETEESQISQDSVN